MMPGRTADRAMWTRLVIAAVLLSYLAIIFVSHFAPFPLFLGGLMALSGWLFLPGLYLLARLRRIDLSRAAQPRVKDLLQPWVMTAGFAAVAAVALFLALGWDVPSFCQGPLNCTKGFQWSTNAGHYYHTPPEGTVAEISRQTYVDEVGVDLRSGATFGVYAMCLAWLAAGVLRAPSQPRQVPPEVYRG
jgi:hypothetical protein